MFKNIEYDNYPLIISSGHDFAYEINCIKLEIFPFLKDHYSSKKNFSLNFHDLLYPNPKPIDIKPNELNNFVLLNLDSINQNGSICVCLLGETFERESNCYKETTSDYSKRLADSMKNAAESGYAWINDTTEENCSSLLEIVSLYAGLMSGIKYPLFYFRVSGGPISDDEQQENLNDIIDNENSRMERLKQKLIRNGLPIKFYGSALEFKEAFKKDLEKIFDNFQEKLSDQDAIYIDQQCFYNERLKTFTINENIMQIFTQLDCLYNALLKWTPNEINSHPDARIAELLSDFFRKEFSDRLATTYQRLSNMSTSQMSSCQDNKIVILTGQRGCGKSSILVNWLESKQQDENLVCFSHFCEASFSSSDLRIMLRSLTKRIRSYCGYNLEHDDHNMHTLDLEMLSLSQRFLGSMLLCKQLGYRLLIIIDGMDHLGDKCATSAKQIKLTDWMPDVIPDNVRIIITSTASDSSLTQLRKKRLDMKILEILPESKYNQDLIDTGIMGLETLIAKYSQILPRNDVKLLEQWQLIKNPLVQKIMAQVYHTLGKTQKFSQFMDKVFECQTVVELVRRVLKLFIHFLNWELVVKSEKLKKKKYTSKNEEEIEDKAVQGWLPDCLSLLALSREGLNLEIILMSLDKLGYVKEFEVSESDIWSLYHLSRDILLKFHNEKFRFNHSICKEIVEHAFLAIASCSSIEARTRECQDSMYIDKRCKLHILLAHNFWYQRNENPDNLLECIYHLDKASEYECMEQIMFIPRVLLKMFDLSVDQLKVWHGQLTNTHKFQYFMKILISRGCNFISKIKTVLNEFYHLELETTEDGLIDDSKIDPRDINKPQDDQKNYLQSEFAKKLHIRIDKFEEQDLWINLDDNHKKKFLLFLAQICVLMDQPDFARKIFNYLESNLTDRMMISHVLWSDICLDSTFHTVFRNVEYVTSALIKLEEITRDLLRDDLFNNFKENDPIRYVRSLCLILKCSINSTTPRHRYFPTEYHELMSLTEPFNSILLDCIIKEMNYNAMNDSKEPQVIREKIFILTNIIVTLEAWTGPTHCDLARLFVKLSKLYELGNSQSKFKAEACCRRALWIWKMINKNNSDEYNHEETECREILFKILLQDPCQSSLTEAKSQIYITFDARMKHLGCYHPNTVSLVPYIKSVSSMSTRSTSSLRPESKYVSTKSSQKSIPGAMSFSRNQSNIKNNRLSIDNINDRISAGSNRSNKVRSGQSTNSSLQFINRLSNNTDSFIEEVDWNEIANSRSVSILSKCSASRYQSASGNNHSRLSLNYLSTPVRSYSASMSNDVPSHIYLGQASSLRSVCSPVNINNKINISGNGKQVRFTNVNKINKAKAHQEEMANLIQLKIHEMKSSGDTLNISKRRSVSANFSRPYSSIIDPII